MRSARAGRVVVIGRLLGVERTGATVVALPFVVVVVSFIVLRALSAADGAVCTRVAVSLRGTAFSVAIAASCGVTPMVVVAEAAPIGAVVWAETLLSAKASTAARGMDLM